MYNELASPWKKLTLHLWNGKCCILCLQTSQFRSHKCEFQFHQKKIAAVIVRRKYHIMKSPSPWQTLSKDSLSRLLTKHPMKKTSKSQFIYFTKISDDAKHHLIFSQTVFSDVYMTSIRLLDFPLLTLFIWTNFFQTTVNCLQLVNGQLEIQNLITDSINWETRIWTNGQLENCWKGEICIYCMSVRRYFATSSS